MDLIPFGWDPFFGENFPAFPSFFKSSFPKIDVQETGTHIVVIADVPGVNPKNVEVKVSADSLHLSGKGHEEKETKGKNFYRKERSHHSFERVIPLPCPVKEDGIKATVKNGTLTVSLPKKHPEALKMKKIPVEEE